MSKILIVEDTESSRDMLTRRLVRAGYEVVSADNGPQGVRLARDARPDLILMDLALGEMDGLEATRLIRLTSAGANTPVIALTIHCLESDRRRSLDAGCDDFDTKPVDLKRLLVKIERQLVRAA
jgi:two-component system, cell cycle response regulator DivK